MENKQCSAAGLLKTAKGGILIPFFPPFGTSQIYLVIKRRKAPHHLRRIGKWERKLCQNPDCRLRNTTGQEMNPQQVKVLKTQTSLINSDSDTFVGYLDGSDPLVMLTENTENQLSMQPCRFFDSDIMHRNSFITTRRMSQRLTYTCLSFIPCSVVWKQTIQRASNHFQLSRPCSSVATNLIWWGRMRWGSGLEEDT